MSKKLVSRESFAHFEWIYGVDKFDDGKVVPWMQLHPDYNPGTHHYFDERQGHWIVGNEASVAQQTERKNAPPAPIRSRRSTTLPDFFENGYKTWNTYEGAN